MSHDNDDPWGVEPAWARESEDGEDDMNPSKGWGEDTDDPMIGAQHVLILIDTHPQMFVPCVRIANNNEDSSSIGLEETDFDESRHGTRQEETHNKEDRDNYGSRFSGSKVYDIGCDKPPEQSEVLITPFDVALMACQKLCHLRVNYVFSSRSGKRDSVGCMLYGANLNNHHPRKKERKSSKHNNEDEYLEHNQALHKTSIDENETLLSSDDDSQFDDQHHHPPISTYELIPLSPPGIEQVKKIGRCLPPEKNSHFRNNGTRKRDLEQEVIINRRQNNKHRELHYSITEYNDMIKHAGFCPLRSALLEGSKSFLNAACVKNSTAGPIILDSKTVWIFTNQDDPCQSNEKEKEHLIVAAKDAIENGLDIHVWPLPKTTHAREEFNKKLIFNHITATKSSNPSVTSDKLPNETMETEDSYFCFDLERMMEDLTVKWKKIRKTQSLPMHLPDWKLNPEKSGIMLDLYANIQIKRRPIHVNVNQETNKMTNKTTQIFATETGEEIVDEKRIQHFYELAGKHIYINPEDMKRVRRKSNINPDYGTYLILLGFKAKSSLINHIWQEFLEKPIFAYPNNDLVIGSRSAFSYLHASMVRKKVIGIGELLLRITSSSRLVAIIPQEEVVEEQNYDGIALPRQITPPGFILIPLPYKDDIRPVSKYNARTVDEDMIDIAMDLVRNQNIEDGVEIGHSFENPMLRNFLNYIESVALGTPLQLDQDDDDTKMNVDGILLSAGTQIEAFLNYLPKDIDIKVERKRKTPQYLRPDETEINWIEAYQTDDIPNFNVNDLKSYLRSVGLKMTGRKADLVDRVRDHVMENNRNINGA